MENAIFMTPFIVGLILVCVLAGLFILFFHKRRKLSPEVCDSFVRKIKHTHDLDPGHAILEAHKIFVAAIQTAFPHRKNMTASETISQVSQRFPNQHKIWKFHRLRNQIAHETDVKATYEQSHEARQEFIRALRSLR